MPLEPVCERLDSRLFNQLMGVNNAPPSASSLPSPPFTGAVPVVGLLQVMLRGSTDGGVPLLRTEEETLGSGTAGGRGNEVMGDVTWTTRSRAWR